MIDESIVINGCLHGTLKTSESKSSVVLIIAGSGPTDRDGNNPFAAQTNNLRQIAEALGDFGIASLRYDKRGVGQSNATQTNEIELRFSDYVQDAVTCLRFLKQEQRFSNIFVLGHSEGSLIGMLAIQTEKVAALISLSGPAENAALLLRKQLQTARPALSDTELNASFNYLNRLEYGELVPEVLDSLSALFRPSVQPYLISWFKATPAHEIQQLDCPVAIIQGLADKQVSVEQAEKLAQANSKAQLFKIQDMTHQLTKIASNTLLLHIELMPVIIKFIQMVQD
jgi:uncharacterized protein